MIAGVDELVIGSLMLKTVTVMDSYGLCVVIFLCVCASLFYVLCRLAYIVTCLDLGFVKGLQKICILDWKETFLFLARCR